MKKNKKKFFMQGWGTYSNQTFVCVNMSKDEITKELKKFADKRAVEDFVKDAEDCIKGNACASVWELSGRTMLWFRKWDGNQDDLRTLVHEIYHLVTIILHRYKDMSGEQEGCAYQFEFLFNEIYTKLSKK